MHNSSLVAIAQYFWRIRTSVLWQSKKINTEAVNDYLPIRFKIRFKRKFPIVSLLIFDPPCRNPVKSVPRGKAIWNANGGFVSVLLTHLFVFLFAFMSTISRQPAGQFTPNFACGHTLVLDVSSPLLGFSGPRGAKKGENEIFVTIGVNFCILVVSERYLSNSWMDPHHISYMSADVPLPPLGSIGPWEGQMEGKLKTQKNKGWSKSWRGQPGASTPYKR